MIEKLKTAALVLALATVCQVASANTPYTVVFDTSQLMGHPAGPFFVYVTLTDASGTGDGNNSAVLNDFTYSGGSPLGNRVSMGGVTGSLETGVTMRDTSPFSFFAEQFIAGTQLSFSLTLSNVTDANGKADRLQFYFLDNAGAPLPTLSPQGNYFFGANLYSSGIVFDEYQSDSSRAPSFGGPVLIPAPMIGTVTAQSITFLPLINQPLSASPITVSAIASSGLPVTFSSNTAGVCTVSGTTVTLLASGLCSITAYQGGGGLYLPAPPVTQVFTVLFLDVPSTAYYYNAVNLFTQYGITAGCGNNNYCPDANVTRAQMAVFIITSIFGSNSFTYSTTPHFSDVQPTDFGFPWIQAMYEMGISAGCGNGNYCPNDAVTRDQMAVFIIAARFGSGASFTYPAAPYFTDVSPSDNTFKFVQRMKLDNITGGCTATTYCPDDPVTRGEMAVFVMAGLFNQLLPASTPLITLSPTTLPRGSSGTFSITGTNTNFVQGTTALSPIPGVTIGAISVITPTYLTVQLTAAPTANPQPYSIVTITGNEQEVLPNGLLIQ
jgi:S-layer homology domain